MVTMKSRRDVAKMREAGRIVALMHKVVKEMIKPGVTPKQLDQAAEKVVRDNGAIPSFKGYYGFPATLCVSVNDELIHGIPSDKPLKEGDIVSIDAGARYQGFHGDAAFTATVGKVQDEYLKLMDVTEQSLYKAIEVVKPGIRVGTISNTIQKFVESKGYHLPKDYTGHGIGKKLHEDPHIPNYGEADTGMRLKAGMTICIEPMVQIGTDKTVVLDDEWTVVSADGSYSAHYEHTLLITQEGCEILTKI